MNVLVELFETTYDSSRNLVGTIQHWIAARNNSDWPGAVQFGLALVIGPPLKIYRNKITSDYCSVHSIVQNEIRRIRESGGKVFSELTHAYTPGFVAANINVAKVTHNPISILTFGHGFLHSAATTFKRLPLKPIGATIDFFSPSLYPSP